MEMTLLEKLTLVGQVLLKMTTMMIGNAMIVFVVASVAIVAIRLYKNRKKIIKAFR